MPRHIYRSLAALLGAGLLATLTIVSPVSSAPINIHNNEDTSASIPNKLEANAKILLQVDQRLARVLTSLGGTPDAPTETALKAMRNNARAIVVRITGVLNDDFPCPPPTIPPPPTDEGAAAIDIHNEEDATASAPNQLGANAKILLQVDQRLARVLAGIGGTPDAPTKTALEAMRNNAIVIVVRITGVFNDNFPCQPPPPPPPPTG